MRILQLHSNFIEYRPVEKEIDSAEECERKTYRFEELVVLFTCVEKGDTEETAIKAIEDLKEFLGKVKTNRVLVYPYAHLSTDLANPSNALKILREMEGHAKSIGIETYRAPFGWC
ncbi:MAG: threonyl-tRNA synthetase editing domain-containing protein, partial [Candidatus Bathyarchaeia archaeon]